MYTSRRVPRLRPVRNRDTRLPKRAPNSGVLLRKRGMNPVVRPQPPDRRLGPQHVRLLKTVRHRLRGPKLVRKRVRQQGRKRVLLPKRVPLNPPRGLKQGLRNQPLAPKRDPPNVRRPDPHPGLSSNRSLSRRSLSVLSST
jgi:hypothetical protein